MKTSTTFFLPILLMSGVSCGPTTDTVKAPFEMSTDFTSSTSGSSPLPGPARARQRLEQFVADAYNGVTCDIAQGHGEYLTSLAVLAGVPLEEQPTFRTEMQRRYAVLSDPLLSRQEASTLVVNQAWSAGYGKAETKHAPSRASGL